jgi:hypothetical protein
MPVRVRLPVWARASLAAVTALAVLAAPLAVVPALAQPATAGPATEPCAASGPRVRAFVALPRGAEPAADGTVEVALCLVASSPDNPIGSYRGELRFDSTEVRVVRVERGRGGLRIENGNKPGRLLFAGAAPTGFREPLVLRAALAPGAGSTALASVSLILHELTAVDGRDLTAGASVAGWPASSPTSPAPTRRAPTSKAL